MAVPPAPDTPPSSAGPAAQTGHAAGRAVERAAWAFYVIAALGSTIGQIWVGVTAPPWPTGLDWWWRALLVTPFAAVIDLGGVVAAAAADWRARLGEAAHGWRALSAAVVVTAVAINVLGHRHVPYLAAVFGGLGVFAYTVWILHAAARRRDALRAAGKLAATAPVYGLTQWLREPTVTRRARSLAVAGRLPLHESLHAARTQLRDEQRHAALTTQVQRLIQARHDDPVLAAIAATTLDIDAVAAALTARADITGWATLIGADLRPPASTQPAGEEPQALAVALPANLLRRIPADQASYDQWRALWTLLKADPHADLGAFAAEHRISLRQAQWIRRTGRSGLLDSPITLTARIAQLANGTGPRPPTPASE